MKKQSTRRKASPKKNQATASLPAKITPPRLNKCFLRKALFQKLDQYRDKPALWISGPAGSGKTMLAASYMQQRKITCLWYQVDARDSDPATLFYYLSLAAKHHLPRRRKALPLFTPDYPGGMSVFVRNFFEALFGQIKSPFALVLDNYQEVVEEALLHQVMHDLLAVVPNGGQVILISRSQPSQALGRFQVHQQMALLDWQKLQLDIDEVQALGGVVQKTPLTRSEATAVHTATLGWAAGVVLMLTQPQTDTQTTDKDALSAPEVVFDYFAAEILGKLDETSCDFMIKSAFLPQVSASTAKALTGSNKADRILADLVHKNCFTLKGSSRPPRYHYHPLFKAFLKHKAHHLLPAKQLKTLLHRAATLLIDHRQYDEAADLLRSSEGWDLLAKLTRSQAKKLVSQGRLETLQGWLLTLPQKILAKQPWLSYWLGICRLPFEPGLSQYHFERAYTGFKSQQNVKGLFLSWAGIVKAIVYQQTDLKPLDQWIKKLERLRKQHGKAPSNEIAARLLTSVLSNFITPNFQYTAFRTWAQQADALWQKLSDNNLHLELGSFLLEYHCYTGNLAKNKRIANKLLQLVESNDTHPYTLIKVYMRAEYFSWHAGDNHQAIEYGRKAQKIAHDSGIHIWDGTIWARMVYAALCQGDIENANTLITEMAEQLSPQSPNSDMAHYHYVVGWYELIQGEVDNAVENLRIASEFIHRLGAVVPAFYCYQGLALALFAQGQIDEAYSNLQQARATIKPLKVQWLDYQYLMVQAYLDLKTSRRETGLDCLRQAITLASKHQFSQFHFWQPKVMAFLYTKALEHSMAVDYVRAMIRRFNILPSEPTLEITHWPWPVRILTLGRFEVQVDDQPVRLKRSGQNKPLTLLKAIIALGGRQVSEEQLWDTLWPEAEGDAAHVAFTTTLHRLRKKIGHKNAITLHGHRVSLDPRYCWVDTWRLEELLSQTDSKDHTSDVDILSLPYLAEELFNLYQGSFLDGADAPWLLGIRERLRAQVMRQINTIAAQYQDQKLWHPAIAIYKRGIEIDPLVENFYQGLMKCFLQVERRSEALATYRRCRTILGDILNVRPCLEIEALGKQLRH